MWKPLRPHTSTPVPSTPPPLHTTQTPNSQTHGIPTSFLPPTLQQPSPTPPPLFLLAGAVVPTQHALWRARCPHARAITTADALPCPGPEGCYPGLGVDRALALRGAGHDAGWPCLVVDAGTALTFTAGTAQGGCGGGAICPGLRLAVRALAERTALLPEVALPGLPKKQQGRGEAPVLPPMFARETGAAIQAGVLHGVGGFVDGLGCGWPLGCRLI